MSSFIYALNINIITSSISEKLNALAVNMCGYQILKTTEKNET